MAHFEASLSVSSTSVGCKSAFLKYSIERQMMQVIPPVPAQNYQFLQYLLGATRSIRGCVDSLVEVQHLQEEE